MIKTLIQYRNNIYPQIDVFDCVIKSISVSSCDIVFSFDENGYWLKESENDSFHRVYPATMTLKKCNVNNIALFIIERKTLLGKTYQTRKYIDFRYFVSMLCSNQCKFEIVQRYYYECGCLFYCKFYKKEKSSIEDIIHIFNTAYIL